MKRAILIVLAMMVGQVAYATNVLTGRVVGVADGDTITVLDGSNTTHRIRLTGIDAPESKMPWGQKSKQSLSGMVYGKEVSVLWDKTDGYERILGKVMMPWGDVNLAQIEAGMAWHYKHYMNQQPLNDRLAYAEKETTARQQRKGLWADSNPTPPWDWRRSKK